jgi:hypothetical protein
MAEEWPNAYRDLAAARKTGTWNAETRKIDALMERLQIRARVVTLTGPAAKVLAAKDAAKRLRTDSANVAKIVHTPPTGAVHGGANVDREAAVATIDAVVATDYLPNLRNLCKVLGLPTRNAAGDGTLSKDDLVSQLLPLRPAPGSAPGPPPPNLGLPDCPTHASHPRRCRPIVASGYSLYPEH